MAIKAVCPECQTVYQLGDSQAGKRVRCKSCQTVFTAEAASRPTAVRGDGPASARAKPTMVARRPNLDAFEDEDEGGQPRRGPAPSVQKKSAMPMILGFAVVGLGLLLLLAGAAITYLVMRDNHTEVVTTNPPPGPPPMMPPPNPPQQDRPPIQPAVQPAPQADNQPAMGQPVAQPAQPAAADASKKEEKKNEAATASRPERGNEEAGNAKEDRTNNGRLSDEGRERVKKATVYLRVKMPDGSMASGSGFFGCKEAKNIVLTNAHVVGMLSPESPRPQSVEVVVNSGEGSEWKTTARVLGVDRLSDLAVLDIGTPSQSVPEPLTVKTASGLHELDDLYVFGFPLGEGLGKEISMRRSSVSAMRKKNGVLEHVQVEGGMGPGNSGGPVIDKSGAVVGVAVGGIPGQQINFAIPGERVQAILDGGFSALAVGQPYFLSENKVAVPVVVDMIDPRNLVKEVGVEMWTGDKPSDGKSGNRPSAMKQPATQAGDSTHLYYKLKYMAPEGRLEIVLPQLPTGKVYWRQPRWINAKGQTHWGTAYPMTISSQPVYRNPANLVLRYTQGAKRNLDLTIENIFRVSNDEDSEAFRTRTVAQLGETVASTGSGGSQLNLRYKFPPSWDRIRPDGRSLPNSGLEQFKDELPRLIKAVVQVDRLGNITGQAIDPNPLRQLALSNPKQIAAIKQFHEKIENGLKALSVSLPPSGTIKPLESWKAERPVLIDTLLKAELGTMDVTFTYLGTRRRDGREEAVINIDGLVHGKVKGIGGKADGQILVDVASGQTILADLTVKLQLKALVGIASEEPRELRLLATMHFHMERKM